MPSIFKVNIQLKAGSLDILVDSLFDCRESMLYKIVIEVYNKWETKLLQVYPEVRNSEYDFFDCNRSWTYLYMPILALEDNLGDVHAALWVDDFTISPSVVQRLCKEVTERYKNVTATVERKQDLFINKMCTVVTFSGGGLWAIAALWWMVLAVRLARVVVCDSVLELIKHSNTEHKELWYNTTDRDRHILLWEHPETESKIFDWIIGCGPIMSKAIAPVIRENNKNILTRFNKYSLEGK